MLAALLASVAWVPAGAGPPVRVRAVAVAADESGASVSLDLSARVTYRVTIAKSPARIALTLHHARAVSGLQLPQPQGAVTGVTAQQASNGDLRLTIFLDRSLPAHVSWDRGSRTVPTLIVRLDMAQRQVQAAHAPRQSGRDIVIAVDAGHGGEDPGATGHAGVHEKDVVLAIARALASRINSEPGMRAVLTRDRDEFLTLRERIGRARAANADLFVSIHADSIANDAVSGSSVYVLSERGASNEAARWLAERENAADLRGGVSLADKGNTLASVLLDLSQSANISASMTAAQNVLGALEGVGLVRKSQVQQAGFVVLKSPDIPSMLVETAYISNPRRRATAAHPGAAGGAGGRHLHGAAQLLHGQSARGNTLRPGPRAHSPLQSADAGAPGA